MYILRAESNDAKRIPSYQLKVFMDLALSYTPKSDHPDYAHIVVYENGDPYSFDEIILEDDLDRKDFRYQFLSYGEEPRILNLAPIKGADGFHLDLDTAISKFSEFYDCFVYMAEQYGWKFESIFD